MSYKAQSPLPIDQGGFGTNGSNGQVLIGGGTVPAWGSITSTDTSLSVSTGANTCNIAMTNFVAKTAWTPVLAFGGLSVGITYTTQSGYYMRIGSMVIFSANIVLSSKGSSTGTMSISGLGFTPAVQTAVSCQTGNITYIAGQIQAASSGSSIVVVNTTSASLVSILTDTFFGNTTAIQLSGTYIL